MCFERARISPDYLYNHVTKDTAELRKLLEMPKAKYRKKLTPQGTIKKEKARKCQTQGFQSEWLKNSLPKSPQEPLEINLASKSRGSNTKKG